MKSESAQASLPTTDAMGRHTVDAVLVKGVPKETRVCMMITHYTVLFWDQVQKDMIKAFKKQISSDKIQHKIKKIVKKEKEKVLRNS